jgi:hypothetical protein
MATDALPTSSPMFSNLLFYKSVEPLDPMRHGKLGMNASDRPYAFAAKSHFVPLQVGEFGIAATHYPIIFGGEAHAPLAVMGVRQGENLFITADGRYRTGAYVPAFVRRYPFIVARDDQAQRSIVCIDRGFDLFTEDEPDTPLFENGQPSAFTQRCISFCEGFDSDSRATSSFMKLMLEMDLFETRNTTYTPRKPDGFLDEPIQIAEYFAISEEKLKALSPAKFAELRDNGALTQIYAHLTSLNGWQGLVLESMERHAQDTAPVANA